MRLRVTASTLALALVLAAAVPHVAISAAAVPLPAPTSPVTFTTSAASSVINAAAIGGGGSSLPASPVMPLRRSSLASPGPATVIAGAVALPSLPRVAPADLTSSGGFAGLARCTIAATCTGPPDPWVAVSSTFVVQAVNLAIRISTRAGSTVTTTAFPTFFGEVGGQQGDSDPHVIWDQAHGRWLATELSWDCSAGHLYLAVSAGSDPTLSWRSYRFDFPGQLPDYPDVGKSSDKVAVSFNLFNLDAAGDRCTGNTFQGGQMYAVDWTALTSGAATIQVGATTASTSRFAWRPANGLTAGAPLYAIVEMASGHVGYATITGTVAGGTLSFSATTDLTTLVGLPAFADPPAPVQPGTPGTIADAVDSRPTDALWQAGHLWFVTTAPCLPSGDSATRDCVRVTEIATTATPSVRQDFVIGDKGRYDFMGGIGLSSGGTMFAVYSQSSSTSFASTLAVAQGAADPVRTTSAPIVVVAGQATYAGTRWGDYVGVAQDPAQADAVWQADEYANSAGSWSTWISRLATDTTPPVGTFTVAGGAASTATSTVPITDAATDTGSGVAHMRVADDGSTWDILPYATSFSWDLTDASFGGTAGDGVKTVTMEWQDGAGNWSAPVAHSITLDTTAPAGSVTIDGGAAVTHSVAATLQLSATDGGSGVAAARIADSPAMTGAVTVPCPSGTCSTPWTLAAGNGPKAVYATFLDRAGNLSTPTSDSIDLDLPIRLASTTYPDLAGFANDRYGTAAAVAEEAYPSGAPIVYVASGLAFPDALGAAAAAGHQGAPVLLVSGTAIPPATIHALQALKPTTIYAMGGPAAISAAVLAALGPYATTVHRLASTTYPDLAGFANDRYGTAAAVAEEAYPSGAPIVYVASGLAFPDALGAAAAAGHQGAPVLLVSGTAIPPATIHALQALKPTTIYAMGGPAAISAAVLAALGPYATTVHRLASTTYPDLAGFANDRYGTAAAVAEEAYPSGAPIVYVASGLAFPDALGAAAAAGHQGAPVLLVSGTAIPPATIHALQALKPTTIYAMGGPAAISAAVLAALATYLTP